MKTLSLFLPLAAVLFLQTAASAQSLPDATERLRDSLKALSGVVEDKIAKDEGRGDIQRLIEKARGDGQDVRDLSARLAGRAEVAGFVVKLRDHVGGALNQLAAHRAHESLRKASNDVAGRLAQFEQAWSVYGYGYARPGGFNPVPGAVAISRDQRATDLAARELANNLRVPINSISITRLQHEGDRYRAFATLSNGARYVIDLNATNGKIYSVTPIR